MPYDITGVILAGGKSSRMGVNKAFIEIGGKRIIDRQIDIFKNIFKEVIIVSKKRGEYSFPGVRVVTDIVDFFSPLSGIYTGLKSAEYERAFVVACDMPFLNRELIEYQIGFSEEFDVVVPQPGGNFEPLHAVYSKTCLPLIDEMLRQRNFRIYDFYNRVKLKIIDDSEIRKFDPGMLSFANVNTMDDLERIKDY